MFWRTVLEVAAAMFAVYGFVCALRLLVDFLFPSRQISVAVEIRTGEDAEMLEYLLREARAVYLHRGRARLTVLLSTALMDGTAGTDGELSEEISELLDRYGAECCLIEPE